MLEGFGLETFVFPTRNRLAGPVEKSQMRVLRVGGNFYADLVQTTSSSAQSARKKTRMIASRKRDGGRVLQDFLVLLIAVGQCGTEKIILRRGETAKGDAITHACVSHRQQSVVTIMLHINQIRKYPRARPGSTG